MILTDTDPDSWNDAGTGTLSVRRCVLQKVGGWRPDVVATTRDDGLPHEYIRYSLYGIPTSYPAMDANRDMVTNSTDETDWLTVFSGGSANIVIGIDTNKDGLVPDTGDFDYMADEAADTAKRGGYNKAGTATGTVAPLRFAYIGGGMSMMGQGPAEGDKVQDASASSVTKVDEEEGEQLPPSSNNNQAPPVNWEVEYWLNFVWDGWNLMDEIEYGQSHARGYAWGLDLSGSLQGAGGVGGLLWETIKGDAERHVCTDGNGNVTGAFDDDGYVMASIVYGPFGETLTSEGDNLSQQMVRFSSKYSDEETGLVYYGYRYYSPGTGRWVSRDMLQESGGRNLYASVGNAPIGYVDFLGMWRRDGASWVGGWGRYHGYVISECHDTLYQLAYYITGHGSDAWLLLDNAGVQSIHDVVPSDKCISVTALLIILEDRLREEAVASTSKFNNYGFGVAGTSSRDSSATIGGFFDGSGGDRALECRGASSVILKQAMINVIGARDYDQIRGGWNTHSAGFPHIDSANSDPALAATGDRVRFLNNFFMNRVTGHWIAWKGENTIKTGPDDYWGYPGTVEEGNAHVGATRTALKWRTHLRDSLQGATDDPNGFRGVIRADPGFKRNWDIADIPSNAEIDFINVATVGMSIFDYRSGLKK